MINEVVCTTYIYYLSIPNLKMIQYTVILGQFEENLFEYGWLCLTAMFDVTCFPAFVGASNVISEGLSMC